MVSFNFGNRRAAIAALLALGAMMSGRNVDPEISSLQAVQADARFDMPPPLFRTNYYPRPRRGGGAQRRGHSHVGARRAGRVWK